MKGGRKERERREERSILFQSDSQGSSEKQSCTELYESPIASVWCPLQQHLSAEWEVDVARARGEWGQWQPSVKERAGAGELGAGLCWWANMTSLHYNLRAHQYFQSHGVRFSRAVRTVGGYCEAGGQHWVVAACFEWKQHKKWAWAVYIEDFFNSF